MAAPEDNMTEPIYDSDYTITWVDPMRLTVGDLIIDNDTVAVVAAAPQQYDQRPGDEHVGLSIRYTSEDGYSERTSYVTRNLGSRVLQLLPIEPGPTPTMIVWDRDTAPADVIDQWFDLIAAEQAVVPNPQHLGVRREVLTLIDRKYRPWNGRLAARETSNHPAPTPPPVQRRRRSHQ